MISEIACVHLPRPPRGARAGVRGFDALIKNSPHPQLLSLRAQVSTQVTHPKEEEFRVRASVLKIQRFLS